MQNGDRYSSAFVIWGSSIGMKAPSPIKTTRVITLKAFTSTTFWIFKTPFIGIQQIDSLSDAVDTRFTTGTVRTALPTWLTLTYGKVLKNPKYHIVTGVMHRLKRQLSTVFLLPRKWELRNVWRLSKPLVMEDTVASTLALAPL